MADPFLLYHASSAERLLNLVTLPPVRICTGALTHASPCCEYGFQARFPVEAFATLFGSVKCNSLRHRLWLVLISNRRHEQEACAFTAALNIEQPVESPGRNEEHAASQEFTAT